MYKLDKKKHKSKRINYDYDYDDVYSYILPSRKSFHVDGEEIVNIILYDKKLGHPFVSRVVNHKFNKLINELMDLLLSDEDDDGDIYKICLDRVEKFRLMIKVKYRKFLMKKELEEMSKKLKIIQKEAESKLISINDKNIVKSTSKGK